MIEVLSHDTSVWLLFSFLIFAFIVWRGAKNFAVNVLDVKIEEIKNELQSAENLHREAQELLAQYQRKHANAVKEAEEIVAHAEEYAARIRKKAKADLKEAMDRKDHMLEERVGLMKAAAIEDIRLYAADIAVDATREIIIKKLDSKADANLVSASIKTLSARI